MRSRFLVAGVLVFAAALVARADDDETAAPAVAPELARLQTHVDHLAGPALGGRGTWEDRQKAAAYVAKQLEEAGLAPLPGMETMLRDHEAPEPFGTARNVVAWLPGTKAGTTKAAPGPYVILSAHYDHLGKQVTTRRDGDEVQTSVQVFNGADDNASGVAALIEIARVLGAQAKAGKRLERSVVFVAFDLEEQNLIGSRRFVESPPLAHSGLRAFVTMDQLGRSLGDVTPGSLFLMGIEHCKDLQAVCDAVPAPENGTLLPLGVDFQPGYSDYVPFGEKKVPYVFVTSGACADYHLVTDVPARIQWTHLVERTVWCLELVKRIADDAKTFTWHDEPAHHPDEAKQLAAVVDDVVANNEARGLPADLKPLLQAFSDQIHKTLEDGEVTTEERRTIRSLALMMFTAATRMQQR